MVTGTMTTTLGTYVYDEAHVDHKQAVGTGKSKYSKLAAIFFFIGQEVFG